MTSILSHDMSPLDPLTLRQRRATVSGPLLVPAATPRVDQGTFFLGTNDKTAVVPPHRNMNGEVMYTVPMSMKKRDKDLVPKITDERTAHPDVYTPSERKSFKNKEATRWLGF
jgi:hypothetical protein